MALTEADPGLSERAMDQSPNARFARDDNLLVKFYGHPRISKVKTKEEGRPIYEDCTYVSIMVPGNKDSIIIRPATMRDKERFPRHYAAHMNREEDVVVGTPLSMWPAITRAQVEELNHFNVVTVEQLADLADSHAQNFRAIQGLKSRAKLFLEASKDTAVLEKVQTALEDRDNEIETLKEAIAAQGEQIKALTEQADDPTPKRKSGSKSGSS